ncbi:MAG TPA: 2-phospho-L-lactate guanylyltransferase [Caulobacteraceae bacterium]|nr:2-phospho-L-lactate guanylyltransferase [Caulobacteraceae bacterium]
MAQAVIAARGGARAKSRCAAVLSAKDREALTAVMLDDMLAALARCDEIAGAWVVTPTAELAQLAAGRGAQVVLQAEPATLNAAFALATARIREIAPYEALMLMPGDLPLLQADDLAAAVHLSRTHAVVLAPSYDGGTGLLGLRAGVAMASEFGGGSFRRHAAAAARRGLSLALLEATSFSHDVDRPEDLLHVLEEGPGARTAAFLRERLRPQVIP